jgi:hypothetical protein
VGRDGSCDGPAKKSMCSNSVGCCGSRDGELSGEPGGELSVDDELDSGIDIICGVGDYNEYSGDHGPGRESPSILGCGPVDSAEPDGALFDLLDDHGPKSGNRRVFGVLVWSAVFANQSSRRFCDVAAPSSATSATLTRTSCTSRATTTGAPKAKLTKDRKRKIREMAMYRRIPVGIVT